MKSVIQSYINLFRIKTKKKKKNVKIGTLFPTFAREKKEIESHVG